MDIKKALEEKKTALLRKRAELEVQSAAEAAAIAEMKTLGVTPETIDARIAELEGKFASFEEKALAMLSEVDAALEELS